MPDLDLNRISAGALERLPGIGRDVARAIVKERTARGAFVSLDDLRSVEGIDERVIKSLRDAGAAPADTKGRPDQPTVLVTLISARGDADLSAHRVTARMTVRAERGEDTGAAEIETEVSGISDARNQVTLTLVDPARLRSKVTILVHSPVGTEVARQTLEERVPAAVKLEVPAADRLIPQPASDPAFGQPKRLRGRVIDQRGERQAANVQVVLFGASGEGDGRALAVARTDSAGYFSCDYPVGEFSSGHAVVAVNGSTTIPIHLEERRFPEHVILVIDGIRVGTAPGEDDDCACHGSDTPRDPDAADLAASGEFSSDIGQGRCVDFTKPDRTLQEFRYHYLVRTTEPGIRGFTIDNTPNVGKPNLAGLFGKLTGGAMTTRALMLNERENEPVSEREMMFKADSLRKAVQLESGLSVHALAHLSEVTQKKDIAGLLGAALALAPGRSPLTSRDPIDWDDDPTVHQATTVAHGHILNFRQEWIADGYSMGKLLYSLPLAPGQKKQIAVVDWERQEQALRQEEIEAEDSLIASLARDRDIGEIVNSTLRESMRGGSESDSGGIGAGLGLGFIGSGFAGLLGVGGGYASASSSAWQNSSRSVAGDSLQSLRDRTSQSASSIRAQRSTVVQTLAQGERTTVTTESVANYNHCHAITVQYFEVLRHLIVRQRLADVQECLFIPLAMTRFDRTKTMRWRNTLRSAVSDRKLREGFDAIERILANYEGSDLPLGSFADEPIDFLSGELKLRFQLARPRDDQDNGFLAGNWFWITKLLPFITPEDFHRSYLKDQQLKDRIFEEQLGPQIAKAFSDFLIIRAELVGGGSITLPFDCTLVSNFRNDVPLSVSLRPRGVPPALTRRQIRALVVSDVSSLGIPFLQMLPSGSRVIVEGATVAYRTRHLSHHLVRDGHVQNDLVGTDAAWLDTSYLSRSELRNPREEDRELARRLLDHLNEHLEHYHHAIWAKMSPDRRFMLMDGFIAPNSGGRSVASVVENRLVGIVGNCIVMPVARGNHLDPTFKQEGDEPVDLLAHYQPNTPIEPLRVAIPTRGVYAEAVMGACNSCERKEEDRFWRWEESPIPDNPPAILPTSTDTRRADPPDLTAKDFAAPIIAMQAVPAAPDPTGLTTAFGVLGKSDLFRDMAGLAGTQANAAAAFSKVMDTATTFGQSAANLALQSKMSKDVDRMVRQIGQAREQGLINESDARDLTRQAIAGAIGAGSEPSQPRATPEQVESLTQTAGANQARVSVPQPGGGTVEVDARPPTRDAEAAERPVIIFPATTSARETRAFNPTTRDLSGEIELVAQARNLPAGGSLDWIHSPPARVTLVGAGERVRVRAVKPGLATVAAIARDAGGVQVASVNLRLSVPQFVTIDEDAAAFTPVLAALKIDGRKADVIREARRVAEHLLARMNVRMVWRIAPFTEVLPAHLPANMVTGVTVRGSPPAGEEGTFGWSVSSAGGGIEEPNEIIELFPGAYDDPAPPTSTTMLDVETRALLVQIESEASPSTALLDLAVKVFGRLIGETMAHEITHAVLGTVAGGGDHNVPDIPNDLMNRGAARNFRQRTGIEDTAHTSPVIPSNFVDHGISSIGGLQATNQGLVDAQLPVGTALP